MQPATFAINSSISFPSHDTYTLLTGAYKNASLKECAVRFNMLMNNMRKKWNTVTDFEKSNRSSF
jgi:hypothetical protein